MPASMNVMSGSRCWRGRHSTPMAVAVASLLVLVTLQQHRCSALPPPASAAADMLFGFGGGGGALPTDPDFPDYWQLPETYIDDVTSGTTDGASLGAMASATEMRGPQLTSSPGVTNTRPAGGGRRRACKPQREKYLLKLLASAIPRLQRFTPVALCPSVRRHTATDDSSGGAASATATTRGGQRGRHDVVVATGRFNMPTSCAPRQLGHNTQCPYKVWCEYNATRYPPLVYRVTCLQRKGFGAFGAARRRGFVTNMPLGCPLRRECGVVREQVPVMRLLDAARCNAQGREQWTVVREMLPVGCACPSPLYG